MPHNLYHGPDDEGAPAKTNFDLGLYGSFELDTDSLLPYEGVTDFTKNLPGTEKSLNPEAAPAAPEARSTPSMLDRLLGGGGAEPDMSAMSNDQMKASRRANQAAALTAMGAQMLKASGPSVTRQSLGQIVGQGLQAGQAGYQQRADAQMKTGIANRVNMKASSEAAVVQKRMEIMGRLPKNPTAQDYQRLAGELAAAGDLEGADKVRDLATKVKYSGVTTLIGPDGLPVAYRMGDDGSMIKVGEGLREQQTGVMMDVGGTIKLINPVTGEVIQTFKKDDPEARRKLQADETALRKEFTQRMDKGDYWRRAQSWHLIHSAYNDNNGVGDIALIRAYMLLLEPMSVVREGEARMAEAAGGMGAWVMNAVDRALRGQRLHESVRKAFVRSAENYIAGITPDLDRIREEYGVLADRYGYDRDNVISDPFSSAKGTVPLRGELGGPLANPGEPNSMTPEELRRLINPSYYDSTAN